MIAVLAFVHDGLASLHCVDIFRQQELESGNHNKLRSPGEAITSVLPHGLKAELI